MSFKSKFVLRVALWIAILSLLHGQIRAACVCNEKGTDYCESCSERRVIRPKPKYYGETPDLNLAPIGDNCWCSKLLVEPAVLPKKSCPKHKKPNCGCSESTGYSGRYAHTPDSTYATPNLDYGPAKPKDDSLPADPISVSLAVQAGKAIEVPEAKLAYGFLQKPVDGLKKIYFSTVPEENLFKLKNDVITLKKRAQNVQKEDEEWLALEEEEEAARTADEDDEQPHLTYKQLGYVTEEFRNPKFRRVSSSYSYSRDGERRRPVPGKVTVDCGFHPGQVAYRKPKPESHSCYQ